MGRDFYHIAVFYHRRLRRDLDPDREHALRLFPEPDHVGDFLLMSEEQLPQRRRLLELPLQGALALRRWRSSTAEQRFCKPQVGGSIPLASSTPRLRDRALRSAVRGYSIPPVSVQSGVVQRRRSGAR